MKKNQTFIFFLLAFFLIGGVSAFIQDSWIEPSQPNCSEGITVCAEINSTFLDYVKISCTGGSTQVNKTFSAPQINNLYCSYISNLTLGVFDGLEVNCLIESNEGEVSFYETETITYSCPECGNNILETGEECDLGLANGVVCSPSYGSSCTYCSLTCSNVIVEGPYCGDGIWQQGNEECEGLFGVGPNQECNIQCEIEEIPPECGNSILETGEECDLGLANGVVCSPSYGSSYNYCSLSCSNIIIEGPYCGDGIWQPSYEECDDGNLINGDGCDNECNEEPCDDEDCKIGSSGTWSFTSFCDSNWKCSGWSECNNGAMTRTCYDTNNCGSFYNKPVEKTGCEMSAPQVFVDGKAVKTVNYSLILIALTFLLLIILIILLATRKKK